MKIYDVLDPEQRVLAFEVPNWCLSRRGLVRIVRSVPGVRVVREPKRWSLTSEDDFCEFEFEGVTFVAEEMFGDSDRYWIGPNPVQWTPHLVAVRDAFVREQPFFTRFRRVA